ncbi:MAG: hypothetical protein OXI83_15160 [Gemmatimonadota bacterium]|nr:hypothetical protein [Gemmatimonadota bacterium]
MAAQHNRARLISLLLLGLTLAVGFMFGLAWDARRAPDVVPDVVPVEETAETVAEPDAEEPAEEASAGRGRGPVIYEVAMEPEQRAAVDEIIGHLRSRWASIEEAREEYDRRQRALVVEAQDSIKAILNPQQIAQYDSLLAVRYPRNRDGRGDERRERRRDDRPQGGEGN